MKTQQLLDEILGMLRLVKDNKEKLQKIHTFFTEEIYEEPEEEEIPEKYKKVVAQIADSLLAGFICYFNPDTFEIEDVPEHMINDPHEFKMLTGETEDSMALKHENWQKCIEFNPMDSHESFNIMKYFIDEVDNRNLQDRLIYDLNHRKPFANFKYRVENSDYRQQWFNFRQKQWEQYVWNEMQEQLGLWED